MKNIVLTEFLTQLFFPCAVSSLNTLHLKCVEALLFRLTHLAPLHLVFGV